MKGVLARNTQRQEGEAIPCGLNCAKELRQVPGLLILPP